MAVAYGSSSSAVSTSGSFSVAAPASTASGDLLIAFQSSDSGSLGISGGSTWTELTVDVSGASVLGYRVAYKIAGGSEPANYTATKSAGADGHVTIIRLTGAAGSAPVFAVDSSGQSGTSISTPSITPAGSADTLIRFVSGGTNNIGSAALTAPASHTLRTTQQSTTWVLGGSATRQLAAGGATGTASFTSNVSLGFAVGITVGVTSSSVPATIAAVTVEGVGDVPAPTVRTGSKASPAVVTGAGDVPSPAVHAGQTVHPDTVEGAGNVPTPNVVAGAAELVEPGVVEGVGSVPAPTVSAVQNATASPTVVEGVGSLPAPTVTATFQATITPDVVEGVGSVPSAGVSVPILPGQLITADGQAEWGGTALWGDGTSYSLLEITGWEAKPQVDSLTTEEPGRHGAYAGRSYLQRRIVTVKLQVQSLSDPTQVSGLLRQLRYDTRTLRDNTLWTLVVRGYTETLLAYGKVIDRTGVMDRDWSIGAPEPVITIECPDSRRYSLDQHSAVIPANTASPTAVVNDGDLYSNPTLRIAGPAVNPLLYNETLDRVLAFDITLGGGDLLIVDTQLSKATIAGVDHENDLADTISVPLKEFFLDVGSSDLSYETDSGGAAGVEVLWRDAHE